MHERLLVLFATVAILACGTAHAQTQFGKRQTELSAELEKAAMPIGIREKVVKHYAAYLESRNNSFRILKDFVASKSEDKQIEKWKNEVAKMGEKLNELSKDISSAIPTHLMSKVQELLKVHEAFRVQEAAFVKRLEEATYAKRRDEMVELRRKLKALGVECEEKWKRELELDAPFDEKQKQIADEIKYQMTIMLTEMAEKNKTFREYVAILIDKSGVAGPITDAVKQPLGKLGEQVDLSAQSILRVKDLVAERVRLYQSLELSEQYGVMAMFADTYATTQKFIDENGYEKAKYLYPLADSENRVFYDQGSDGQRSDAKEFHDLAMKGLSDNLQDLELDYKKFINAHQGKFLGPMSPDIQDLLLETRAWENFRVSMDQLNLEDTVRRWRDENYERFLYINLTDAPEVTRRNIKDYLAEYFKKLDYAISALKQSTPKGLRLSDHFDRKEITAALRYMTR